MAFMFDEMGQYDSALLYHLKALKIRETLTDKHDLAHSLIGTGRGYRFAGNFKLASDCLFKAVDLSSEIKSKPMLVDAYLNLSELYAETGDYKKAHHFLELYKIMSDSILNEESSRQMNNLQIRYETEKKDQQITLLAKEKEIQEKEADRQSTLKNVFLAGLTLVILLTLLLGYVYKQKLKNQKLLAAKDTEISEAHFKRQMTDLEMKALRAQINPHFLFNCLNSINRMIVKGENENASLYLKKFSKLVRLIVENVETNRVSLENELALIESYIQLEELRFKGKIGYEIFIDEKIEKENTFLPPMVLQPFVENAIWHGLMHKETNEQGHIKIAVKEDNDTLLCTIEDNGVGRRKSEEMKEKNDGKTKSIGIKVTEERLKLLSKERIKELIRIVDLKDTFDAAVGTRVEISIPIS